jgi:proline iminopeptidase
MVRALDPARYRVVLWDQRGCGGSTPHASEPGTDMHANTTGHLVADMERLREHLGIGRWLLCGGSWGATLALAYAEQHPERVSEMVLSSITTSRRTETAWLYGGAARFFPEAYERFRTALPACDRHGDLVGAYARAMEHPDPTVRIEAARAWCAWEDAVLSLEPNTAPGIFSEHPEGWLVAFVRICAHYAAHGAWLDEGALIRDAGRLKDIPGVLIHGRRDMSCPIESAWELARAWPGAELIVLDDSGHLRSDSRRMHMLAALDRFAGM